MRCIGTKKEKLNFVETKANGEPQDEIKAFIFGRTVCAMSACWRFFGYQTYPGTRPSVFLIKPELPEQVKFSYDKDQCCQLSVYLNRPRGPLLDDLKFTQFFKEWTYAKKEPKGDREHVYCIDNLPGRSKYYVFKLVKPDGRIVRMQHVPFGSGEIWYLRKLLDNVSCRTLEELKNGFKTFQEGAKSRNLLPEAADVRMAFEEAMAFGTPAELRSLFVQLTLEAYPTLDCFNVDTELREMLFDGFPKESVQQRQQRQRATTGPETAEMRELRLSIAEKCFINYLAVQFRRFNKTNDQYGFPLPTEELETELQEYRARFQRADALQQLEQLQQSEPNNLEQAEFYRIVTDAISLKETKLIFLQGQGGSGKSSIAKKIMQFARSIGLVALGCASTGLACQVYPVGEFVTAHSLFGIPVFESEDEYDDAESAYQSLLGQKKNEGKLELLLSASVIIWDEFLRYRVSTIEYSILI